MSKQHAVFIIFELLSLSSHSNILIFLRISQNSRKKKSRNRGEASGINTFLPNILILYPLKNTKKPLV